MTEKIEQRTEEWFKICKGRVTGSNVGAILGLSPFMKPEDVMRRMVRDWHNAPSEFTGNAATEYGTFHEKIAKMDYEMKHVFYKEAQEVGFYTFQDWLGASPDGLIGDDGLIEIKCPYGQRDKNPPVFKNIKQQMHYYAQIQVQLFVTQRTVCAFYQWSPHGSTLEHIPLNPKWLEENLPMLKLFYEAFLEEREFPRAQKYLIEKHLPESLDALHHANALLGEYLILKDQLDELEAKKKALLEEIVMTCGEKDSVINGHKLTKVTRAGSISYAKAIKDLCPDADLKPYTGQPTEFWKLS